MSQMMIGDLFAKDVSRAIEGVIKADDAKHLATEIDEYVLTGETAAVMTQRPVRYRRNKTPNGFLQTVMRY